MENQYDLIVVGGGISGLSLARFCQREGVRVAILEAQPQPGGAIHTSRTIIGSDPFWLELGAHTLFNSYTRLLRLIARERWDDLLLPRRRLPFRLWRNGRFRSIGGALHWGELARHLPRAVTTPRVGLRIGDYFSTVAGPRNYTRIIAPSLDGLLCQPADEFPAELIFKRRTRTRGFPRSFSLRAGLTTLVEQLADETTLLSNMPVSRITSAPGGFVCETASTRFTAARIALAVPANEAARLMTGIDPPLAQQLAQVAMAEVDSTAVVTDAKQAQLAPLAGAVARDAPFYSIVARDVVPHPALRGFTFHFSPGLDEAQRLAVATEVLGVERRAFLHSAHAHHRLPALRLGHAARVQTIDALLAGRAIALTGNYFGGVSIEDCVTRSAQEAARLLG